MSEEIVLERMPEPTRRPIVGNMLTIDKDEPLQGLMEMTRDLGGIFRLDMMGTPIIVVSDPDIVAELSDESRFDKAVRGALRRVRAIGGDGLFTGNTQDPNWQKAHNILLPTFAHRAMDNYLPMMVDVAEQCMSKWERLNSDDEIDVVHDMTAIALDTIGVCGFNYRFNSFYRNDYHPFIDALNRTLETCMMQRGLPFEEQLLRKRLQRLEKDVAYMNGLVDAIIRERRAGKKPTGDSPATNDLMSYMLEGVDPKTGESLSDENIRYQINTFLIAGHETTSGLMSFTLYYLLNNPEILARAVREVDEVLGRDISVTPTLKQVNALTYVQQILSEGLRLWPTAPALGLYPYEDEIVGGKYKLKKGTFVNVLLLMLHRDPKVWKNPEVFDPDRFAPEEVAKRPIHAYKPFGNGQRACIGRQFAMQEATLVIGMILQRFQLFDHTNYQLKIKESLSIKPDGFRMKVKPRADVVRGTGAGAVEAAPAQATPKRASHGTKALVLYGSNLGTTEEIARHMARTADLNGFDVDLGPLDNYTKNLPKEGVVLIASASYNGKPPDNAAGFLEWVQKCAPGDLEGVHYSIFGCGHSDWVATYQDTPRAIDEAMQRAGATRVHDRAEGDAKHDLDEAFDGWVAPLWGEVGQALGLDVDFGDTVTASALYSIEYLDGAASNLLAEQIGAKQVNITESRELQAHEGPHASDRSTRHIEVSLAPGQTYAPGDHLSVVPRNPPDLVRRVENRFDLTATGLIRLNSADGPHASLPTDRPIKLRDLLFEMVELQSPASRRDLELLARHTRCPDTKAKLEKLAGADFATEVQGRKISVLDLLEKLPACELPFEVFLETCPNMVPRYYSISSSPKAHPGHCTITVAVVAGKALGREGRYEGVCSNYLAHLEGGTSIHVATRKPSAGFTLPDDPATPIIMIGPGTGLAPFRGFMQEREALAANGDRLGDAMLFFGCRHPEQDFIYEEELKGWDEAGLCTLHTAFSRVDDAKAYVQDLIAKNGARVWSLIEAGAKIYVCGDGGRMEPDVRRTLAKLAAENGAGDGEAFMANLMSEERYVLDVWVSD